MDITKIGAFIAMQRKNKNMTQTDLADKIGVTFKAVSKWECGNGLPDVSIMKPLCDFLEITLSELLVGEKIVEQEKKQKIEEQMVNLLKERQARNKKRVYILALSCVSAALTIAMLVLISVFLHIDYGVGFRPLLLLSLSVIMIISTFLIITFEVIFATKKTIEKNK